MLDIAWMTKFEESLSIEYFKPFIKDVIPGCLLPLRRDVRRSFPLNDEDLDAMESAVMHDKDESRDAAEQLPKTPNPTPPPAHRDSTTQTNPSGRESRTIVPQAIDPTGPVPISEPSSSVENEGPYVVDSLSPLRPQSRSRLAASEETSSNRPQPEPLSTDEKHILEAMGPYAELFNCCFRDLVQKWKEKHPGIGSLQESFQLVLTDPPYGIRQGLGRSNSDYDTLSTTDMVATVELISHLLRAGGHCIIFCAFHQLN